LDRSKDFETISRYAYEICGGHPWYLAILGHAELPFDVPSSTFRHSRAGFEQIPQNLTRTELFRYFTFTADDRYEILQCRGDHPSAVIREALAGFFARHSDKARRQTETVSLIIGDVAGLFGLQKILSPSLPN
jgi:hypothetical protein